MYLYYVNINGISLNIFTQTYRKLTKSTDNFLLFSQFIFNYKALVMLNDFNI